jgi:hypothetical protein
MTTHVHRAIQFTNTKSRSTTTHVELALLVRTLGIHPIVTENITMRVRRYSVHTLPIYPKARKHLQPHKLALQLEKLGNSPSLKDLCLLTLCEIMLIGVTVSNVHVNDHLLLPHFASYYPKNHICDSSLSVMNINIHINRYS